MKYLGLAFLIFVLLVSPSCEKEVVEEPSPLAWEYGKNEYNIEIDGVERNFLIHVPEKYSHEAEVPMVMMLHGSTGTGTKFYNISRWVEKADQEGFIAVFPTALAYPLKENNRVSTKWSSDGLIEQVVEGTEIKDDIPFIEELVELCKQSFLIDGRRIYISGFSNGGGFVKSDVITRLPHVFAAASSAGGIGHPIEVDILEDRMIPFHNIAGVVDPSNIVDLNPGVSEVPIQAGQLIKQQTIWSNIQRTLSALQLNEEFTEDPVIPKYNQIAFRSDISGQGNEYMLVLVNELEHNYPNEINNTQEVVAADMLWDWFMEWELEE